MSLLLLSFPFLCFSWSRGTSFLLTNPHQLKGNSQPSVLNLLSQDCSLPIASPPKSLSYLTFPSPPVFSCVPQALSHSCQSPGVYLLVAFILPSQMLPRHAFYFHLFLCAVTGGLLDKQLNPCCCIATLAEENGLWSGRNFRNLDKWSG